jgi:hypothetical protein
MGGFIKCLDMNAILHGLVVGERGTHKSLMKARGFYYDLYMSQFRRQEPDAEAGSYVREPDLSAVAAPAGN